MEDDHYNYLARLFWYLYWDSYHKG
jgi:hypothetical protein